MTQTQNDINKHANFTQYTKNNIEKLRYLRVHA